MTATRGDIKVVAVPRYQQVLRLLMGLISALLQSALVGIRSVIQLVRPHPSRSLAGEIVLVTGAGQGIGRQLALEFWAQGCIVICVDINEERNQQTAQEINTRHCQRLESNHRLLKDGSSPAYAYTCDVTDRNQVAEMARSVQKELGHVDILVNNAGNKQGTFIQAKPIEVVDVVNANLLSHFWTLLAFLPGMVERNHGHIVAVLSEAGLCALTNKMPYSASKLAVAGLMDALSEELRLDSHHIRLTCAHSYLVHTQPDRLQNLDFRIPEMSPEHAASEIVNAVRHNLETITIPKNLLLWINVLRTLPQDAREIWRDLFQSRVVPTEITSLPPQHQQTANKT